MKILLSGTLFLVCSMLVVACDYDDDDDNYVGDGGVEYTGQPCEGPEDCYPDLDADLIIGDIECLSERVEGGYCTHLCNTDDDCCAVEGECATDLPQVCAPLESAPSDYCFVTCEDVEDEESYCETYVHPEFHCRSTGGGSDNRKVCLPI